VVKRRGKNLYTSAREHALEARDHPARFEFGEEGDELTPARVLRGYTRGQRQPAVPRPDDEVFVRCENTDLLLD
jgi:hypothetical protein